jgi:hypothetical protein
MTPRERLTPKEIQIAILVWEGLTNREIGPDRRHQRTGNQESSSKRIRQARRVEPIGVGHVRRQPWWKGLAGSRWRARPLSPGGGSGLDKSRRHFTTEDRARDKPAGQPISVPPLVNRAGSLCSVVVIPPNSAKLFWCDLTLKRQ